MLTIGAVTVLVQDYDDAIGFWVDAVGFELIEDSPRGDGSRWVVVGAAGSATRLVLARATGTDQLTRIGRQTGSRVGFFLHTDDFPAHQARMIDAGVRFAEHPRHEEYGTVTVFVDHVGNRWDLIPPR